MQPRDNVKRRDCAPLNVGGVISLLPKVVFLKRLKSRFLSRRTSLYYYWISSKSVFAADKEMATGRKIIDQIAGCNLYFDFISF